MAEAKPTSTKIVKGIHQAIKGLKGQKEKLGIKRQLTPESRHHLALVRFLKAATTRGWIHSGSGKYAFRKRYELTTHEDFEKGFHVLVEDTTSDDNVIYKIDLGQGAINELDQFVALTELIGASK